MAARQAYKAMLQDAHPEPRAPPGQPAPGPSPVAEDGALAPAGTEEPPYRECWAGAGWAKGPLGLGGLTTKSPCPGEQRSPPREVTRPLDRGGSHNGCVPVGGLSRSARAGVGLPTEGRAAVCDHRAVGLGQPPGPGGPGPAFRQLCGSRLQWKSGGNTWRRTVSVPWSWNSRWRLPPLR